MCEEEGVTYSTTGLLALTSVDGKGGGERLQERAAPYRASSVERVRGSDVEGIEPILKQDGRHYEGVYCKSSGIVHIGELMSALTDSVRHSGRCQVMAGFDLGQINEGDSGIWLSDAKDQARKIRVKSIAACTPERPGLVRNLMGLKMPGKSVPLCRRYSFAQDLQLQTPLADASSPSRHFFPPSLVPGLASHGAFLGDSGSLHRGENRLKQAFSNMTNPGLISSLPTARNGKHGLFPSFTDSFSQSGSMGEVVAHEISRQGVLGLAAGDFSLGEVKVPSGKVVTCDAMAPDADVSASWALARNVADKLLGRQRTVTELGRW